MKTQDQEKPNHSGNDGNGGVHVCHKCGWPFPKAHPSSKHRKAHKRVCGTIEGYRLDNNGVRDTTPSKGCVVEPNSDDEPKTPSEKDVERSISRKGSSSVSSKLSGTTISEEDVYTDAGTELTRENSDGLLQRYYSMQNGNELDDTFPSDGKSADKSRTPDLPVENKVQTIQVEGENKKRESNAGSEDHPSKMSKVMDIVSEKGREVVSGKDKTDIKTSYSETPKEVAEVTIQKGDCGEVKGVSNEVLGSGYVGFEDSNENFNSVPGKDKIEGCIEVQDRDFDFGNIVSRKLDLSEECDSKIGTNEKGFFQEADQLSTKSSNVDINISNEKVEDLKNESTGEEIGTCTERKIPVTSVENVSPEGATIDAAHIQETSANNEKSTFQEPDQLSANLADINKLSEIVKHSKNGSSGEEKVTCTERKISVFPEGATIDAAHIQETSAKNEKSTFQEPDQLSANLAEINKLSEIVKDSKNGSSGEEKVTYIERNIPVTSLGNVFPEGVTMDAAHIQETSANKDFNVSDDGSKFSENNVAVGDSVLAKPVINVVASRSLELINTPDNSGVVDVDHYGVSDKILESIDILAGQTEKTGENARNEACRNSNGTDAIMITDDLNSTSKLEKEDAERSSQSSVVVSHCSSDDKFAVNASCTAEGDEVMKPQVIIPVVDNVVDSGSQSDSLEGNWGSVSAMSATSDAQPTVDAIASIQPRALPQNEIPGMVQESVTENQISVKTETVIERMEPVSEIQTSALQTGSTPTDSLVATELDKGNKGKEIIGTVSNQDSGKQRTPLKTLLGEAIAKSREESPVHHSQSSSPVQQTETVTLDADHPETEAAMEEETEKEWNSPARYPVNIKAEKKRSKSRPWVPFLCCSSVNAR